MKAIIIDDEPLMLRSFCRYLKHIPDQEIIGQFEDFCQRGRCGDGCIGRNISEMD